ncbi:MAG: glycosyl transferase [Candidatus Omnitrophica bacterium]|nr:glycosyl transferase [Candidatus Omnitrophota bacterium]
MISLKTYLIPFFTSFALSIFLTPLVRRIALSRGYVAKPTNDRWHKTETVLFGGIAIFISFIVPYVIFTKPDINITGIILCGGMIFALGLFDDIKHIKPHTKLIGQIIIASLLVSFGVNIKVIPYQIISMPLTVLWIVAIVNSFNLLDNMDGLSAGIAAIVSSIIFVFALLSENLLLALPALILAGSLLGFLRYNFNPAKIFMGDSGSMFIGFMLAAITLQGSWKESTHLVMMLAIPVLVLAVPILDTVFVAIARGLSAHKIFQGGKDHISHRMVVLGLSDKKTVIALYCISILFGGISVLSMFVSPMVTLMLVLVAAITLIYFATFLGKVKVYTDLKPKDFKKRSGKVILDGMLMHKRRMLEVGVDFILICVAYVSAYLLRFEGILSLENQSLIVKSLPIVVIIKYAVFFKFGLYRGIWRYVSVTDLIDIFKAILFASIAAVMAVLFVWRFQGFSRAVFVIDWLLLFVLISGTRILERIYKEIFDQASLGGKNVLIYGAGDAGEIVLREIKNNKILGYKPVGFLDDDEEKMGRRIHGVSVLGSRSDMTQITKRKDVHEIIIAIPDLPNDLFEETVSICRSLDINCKKMQDILPR